MPNSSAPTAKTKSVWLSGRMRLTVPSPGPAAEPAAAREAFQREIDVEGVARAGSMKRWMRCATCGTVK